MSCSDLKMKRVMLPFQIKLFDENQVRVLFFLLKFVGLKTCDVSSNVVQPNLITPLYVMLGTSFGSAMVV